MPSSSAECALSGAGSWGSEDPALDYEHYGEEIRQAAKLTEVHKLPARHFLQEDQWRAVAAHIAGIAGK